MEKQTEPDHGFSLQPRSVSGETSDGNGMICLYTCSN